MGSPPCARSHASMTPEEAKAMWTLVGRGLGHTTGAKEGQAQRSCGQQRTGETRTQHFMNDSQCQQKLLELQLLLEALSNARRTRKDVWDPSAKASLMKFCKGCTHQNVFGCQVGVLPAVPAEDLKETRWLDGQAAQTLTPALREGWETWWVDGDGNCFWRALSLSIWRSQRFYRQVKLVVLAYAAGNSETLVSKGRHLHDNITYYDASVVQKFIGAERAAQHERMLLAELAPLCANRGWAGRITAYLASEALGCTVKFIHPVDKKARVKQDAGAVTRGREKKSLTFGDNRWSRTYVPTGPHTALRVRGVGGKQDTFVEEATVTFTKHVVERRVSTQSELEALNIAAVEGDTDVEGLCHFAAILPKDGNARPFPVHEAAPPLYMSKDKEAKRLYDAELAAYAGRCVARTAALQKAKVEATAARQQANPDAEAKVKAAARQQAETKVEAAATRQRAEVEVAAAAARQQAEVAAAAAAAAPQQHAGVDGDAEAKTKRKVVARQQALVESTAAEALQQAWVQQPGVESAAVAARQQPWTQQSWADAAAAVAAAWQQPGMEAPAVAAWQQSGMGAPVAAACQQIWAQQPWAEAPAAAARQQPWEQQSWAKQPWAATAQQQSWAQQSSAQQPGVEAASAAARQQPWEQQPWAKQPWAATAQQQSWAQQSWAQQSWAQQPGVEAAPVAAWQQPGVQAVAVPTWQQPGAAEAAAAAAQQQAVAEAAAVAAWQQAWVQQTWAAAAVARQQPWVQQPWAGTATVAPWLQPSAQQPYMEATAVTGQQQRNAEPRELGWN